MLEHCGQSNKIPSKLLIDLSSNKEQENTAEYNSANKRFKFSR